MALLFGLGFERIDTDKVEFAAVEQFPLDIIVGFQADGGGQGLDGDFTPPAGGRGNTASARSKCSPGSNKKWRAPTGAYRRQSVP